MGLSRGNYTSSVPAEHYRVSSSWSARLRSRRVCSRSTAKANAGRCPRIDPLPAEVSGLALNKSMSFSRSAASISAHMRKHIHAVRRGQRVKLIVHTRNTRGKTHPRPPPCREGRKRVRILVASILLAICFPTLAPPCREGLGVGLSAITTRSRSPISTAAHHTTTDTPHQHVLRAAASPEASPASGPRPSTSSRTIRTSAGSGGTS